MAKRKTVELGSEILALQLMADELSWRCLRVFDQCRKLGVVSHRWDSAYYCVSAPELAKESSEDARRRKGRRPHQR